MRFTTDSLLIGCAGSPPKIDSLRLQLWKAGVDWNKISDFELFSKYLVKSFTPKDTYLLFGDLNFSWFEYVHDNKKDSSFSFVCSALSPIVSKALPCSS